jgi:hypothetical protein
MVDNSTSYSVQSELGASKPCGRCACHLEPWLGCRVGMIGLPQANRMLP